MSHKGKTAVPLSPVPKHKSHIYPPSFHSPHTTNNSPPPELDPFLFQPPPPPPPPPVIFQPPSLPSSPSIFSPLSSSPPSVSTISSDSDDESTASSNPDTSAFQLIDTIQPLASALYSANRHPIASYIYDSYARIGFTTYWRAIFNDLLLDDAKPLFVRPRNELDVVLQQTVAREGSWYSTFRERRTPLQLPLRNFHSEVGLTTHDLLIALRDALYPLDREARVIDEWSGEATKPVHYTNSDEWPIITSLVVVRESDWEKTEPADSGHNPTITAMNSHDTQTAASAQLQVPASHEQEVDAQASVSNNLAENNYAHQNESAVADDQTQGKKQKRRSTWTVRVYCYWKDVGDPFMMNAQEQEEEGKGGQEESSKMIGL